MFNIVIKETKEFFREKAYLFFFLLFPVVLVFLLGNLLQSTDIAEKAIGKIKIMYLIDTENPYQREIIKNFVSMVGESDNLSFSETEDIEKAKLLVGDDEITAAVIFKGDPLGIQIYEGTDRIRNRTVEAVMNGFIQTDKTVMAVMRTAPQVLTTLNKSEEDYTVEKDLGYSRSMIDYYAISMVMMIAFMSVIVGTNAFMSERRNKTINRMIIAPQNRISIFLQKVLGMLPQTILQVTVIMGISIVVFDAHYGAGVKEVVYLFLMFCAITFCMISLGVILGLLFKNVSPFVLTMPVIWLMMFFGGTYSKDLYIKGITELMPNYIFQQAAYELSVFGHYAKATQVILICSVITMVSLTFGAFIFYKKEEER